MKKGIVSAVVLLAWVAGASADLITTTTKFITGVSIAGVSSENTAGNRGAVNTINSGGLNSNLEHSSSLAGHLWEAQSGDPLPDITFNLGDQYHVGLIRVWNHNGGVNTTRGLKDVEIWVSLDNNPANLVFAETVTFAQAPGTGGYLGEVITLTDLPVYKNVRLIKLDATSNHGNTVGGLSEIRFVQVIKPWNENRGERLYNGIVLPERWPPKNIDPADRNPMPVPYLDHPPAVIPIDVGRQLFVDDFLIESTDLLHMYHLPEKHPGNPILTCETDLERQTGIVGGVSRPCVWWHPEKQLFYMWYLAGTYFRGTLALATSPDGIRWTRPALDVKPGTNQALPPGFQPDSSSIVPDWECADPRQRFKLFSTNPGKSRPAFSFVSPDGVHWTDMTQTGVTGDRSSMFYNPFRKSWVYSLRSWCPLRGRSRHYRECEDFLAGAPWTPADRVPWLAADSLDAPEPGYKDETQLYNFDAVPYESVMLGFFELHRGPENKHCERMGLPKLNEISFGYSRDGFHFSRPDRRAHIPASRKDDWERGYIESGGNICVVVGDRLHFYYSGCRGDMDGAIRPDGKINSGSMYDPNAIGLATLRRDGFASLFAGASTGHVTTHPVTFGGKHLFVNVDAPEGMLRAEVLDMDGNPIEPFTMAKSIPVSADSTLTAVAWEGNPDLSALAGQPVRFRFELTKGSLYAFWVSQDETGRSGGYVAGGGPGYTGATDTVGRKALK